MKIFWKYFITKGIASPWQPLLPFEAPQNLAFQPSYVRNIKNILKYFQNIFIPDTYIRPQGPQEAFQTFKTPQYNSSQGLQLTYKYRPKYPPWPPPKFISSKAPRASQIHAHTSKLSIVTITNLFQPFIVDSNAKQACTL